MPKTPPTRSAPVPPLPDEDLGQYRVRLGYRRASTLSVEIAVTPSIISRLENGIWSCPNARETIQRHFGLTEEQLKQLVTNSMLRVAERARGTRR